MSVYSGFSTRKLESNYMSTTYQLMEFLSATLIKYRQILQNFKKKDDNLAEFLQVNQLEFQLIFNRLYYSLVKLEESKYMEPKFSLSTKALKKYLENQTSLQQMKKIEQNNQKNQETDQIDEKQKPFSSDTNKLTQILKKQDSSEKEIYHTDTLKNTKVIQYSQIKEKKNNLAFQKGRSLTQNQSNDSKINLKNRNKQNQQKNLNDFQQVDQQDNILFIQSPEQQQNIRKKKISIQLTPQTSKNNSSIQKIKQGEQQEQQDQYQNQKLILYQPCSQNSSQLDKNNDNYTKNFSNNFVADSFQGKDQQPNKNMRYKRNFQQKQIQVPLDDKQNISSTKNKDFLIKYKRTSSEHQIQDIQFIQSNSKQVKLQLQKQQELEEQLKRDQQYLAQIQQQKHLYQLQQNQIQQNDNNEEQKNNNQQLKDSKNNFKQQSSNLNKGKHQQIYKSIDNLKGNIQNFQSTFELIKQVKDENVNVTVQKHKKNNFLFEEQKLGLQTPQRIEKQKSQQQNQIILSDIQDQNQIYNNNNPSKNYSDDQLQNIQIQQKLKNKHVVVYSNPHNINLGRKKINSCDYRNTNSVQSSSQKRNDFKNLFSSQSKQIPNISFLDIDNQYSKDNQKHYQVKNYQKNNNDQNFNSQINDQNIVKSQKIQQNYVVSPQSYCDSQCQSNKKQEFQSILKNKNHKVYKFNENQAQYNFSDYIRTTEDSDNSKSNQNMDSHLELLISQNISQKQNRKKRPKSTKVTKNFLNSRGKNVDKQIYFNKDSNTDIQKVKKLQKFQTSSNGFSQQFEVQQQFLTTQNNKSKKINQKQRKISHQQ